MKYVSGRVKELKVGISSHSESKTSLTVIGNANVGGSVTAASFVGGGINTTGTSEFTNLDLSGYLNVAGVSTFASTVNLGNNDRLNFNDTNTAIYGNAVGLNVESAGTRDIKIQSNASGGTSGDIILKSGSTEVLKVKGVGNIVGAATSNIIPFLYSNYSLFPSATTYHGAVAHAHNTGKLYYAHAANWIELVNKETNGTVGTGTEKYDIGITSVTNLRVAGISTYDGNLDIQSSVLITGITTIGGLVDINAGAQANTLKVEDLTDNRVVIAGTGGELEDDANLTFNGTTFNVGSAITMYQATGIISATKYHGDGSSLTGIDATSLKDENGNIKIQANSSGAVHSGIATFTGNINANGNIIGDGLTNISGIASITVANRIAHTGDDHTSLAFGPDTISHVVGGVTRFSVNGNTSEATFTVDTVNLYGNLNNTGVSTFNDDVSFVGAAGTIFFDKSDNALEFSDDTQLRFGTSPTEALKIYHNSSDNDTYITNGTTGSNLYVRAWATNKELYLQAKGNTEIWSGTTEQAIVARQGGRVELYNSNTKVLQTMGHGITVFGGVDVSGVSTFTNTVLVNGGSGLQIGDGNASLYRTSNDLYIDVAGNNDFYVRTNSGGGTGGKIYLQPKPGENGIVANSDGSVEIYHDNSPKLETIGAGVTVTGDLYATTFRGNGSGLTNLSIPGISTSTTSEFTNIDVTGTTTLATAKVSDLTDNRIVIAGNAGELEDTSKLTFDGTTLAIVGNATFTGNVSVAGTLTSEDKTNIDSIGIVTARTGVRISSGGLVVTSGVSTFTDAITANGNINANGNIVGDSATNISGINNVSASTLTGTLQTAAQPNVTSLGTITNLVASSAKVSDLTSGRVVYVGTAGELQDISTFTFNGSTVTAPAFAGDGSALTGITAGGVGAIGGLTVKDEGVVVGTAGSISTLDFLGATVSVIANTGAAGIATVTIATEQKQDIQTLNVSGVSTFAGNTNITGDIVSDLTILSTDAGSSAGPIINLYRNSATPADADYLGQIKFQGESDTGVQRNYAKITGKILDASNTDEDGILEFAFLKGGSNNISGRFRSDSLQLLNGTSLTVAGTAEIDGNITANGDIIGDGATNISGMNNVTATNFNSTSDARLKTNVQTITSPLEKLNQIDGVSFDWVTDLNPYDDESSSMGVIADTVQKVLPVLVSEHATGYKTVNYNGLIGLLIEAVKEQQVQITELKSKLDSLS